MKRELAISIMALVVASASFIVAIATPANSATVRMYSPGGAPCAGACSLPWAAAEFGVPIGEPERMVIPAGSSVHKMSYGRDGQPHWVNDSAIFAEDQPGIGYQVPGTSLWMVRIDECQNWALVTLGTAETFGLEPAPTWTTVTYSPPPPPFTWTPWTTTPREPWTPPTSSPPPVVVDPPIPSAVPLPASAVLLLAAIGGLGLVKMRSA